MGDQVFKRTQFGDVAGGQRDRLRPVRHEVTSDPVLHDLCARSHLGSDDRQAPVGGVSERDGGAVGIGQIDEYVGLLVHRGQLRPLEFAGKGDSRRVHARRGAPDHGEFCGDIGVGEHPHQIERPISAFTLPVPGNHEQA